jgi:hypothetical protein
VSAGTSGAPGQRYDSSVTRRSTLAIVALWVCVVVDAAWDAVGVRADEFTKGMPVWMGLASVVVPLVLFPLCGFFASKSPFFVPSIARRIDARVGEGATADFLHRWRPLLMFSAGAAVYAAVLGVRLWFAGTATHEWWLVGFYVGAAAGTAFADAMLRRRAVPGA